MTGSTTSPDPVRYGVVGTGMMGIEHIQNILALDGATVTAISDTNHGSRVAGQQAADAADAADTGGRRADRRPGGVAVFGDHRDLIASGLCDAVVVATPNHTHIDVVPDLLATELHLMIEKPLCTTVSDCERLLALEARRPAGTVTWMAMEYRYMPAVAELVRLVHGGAVGTPRMVAIREHRYPFLVKVDNWNRFSVNTGGTLVEKTCHFFDLMNLILGERPWRVMASGAQDVNHLDERYDGRTPDILDNAFVIVDYPSGARALLDLCMFAEATDEQEELSVVGELGKVEARLPSNSLLVGRRRDHWIGGVERSTVDDARIGYEGFHHGSSYIEHLLFTEAIRGAAQPEVTLDDGYWAVAMGAAAHRSIDLGRPVELTEVMSGADPERDRP